MHLNNSFAVGHFTVTVVGCGGTGGFVAESLARLLPPRVDLVLIDHDRVEERNLLRQNFTRAEVGQFKSEALARRLSTAFDRPIGYSTLPIGAVTLPHWGLVIGCVDNGLARRDIARQIADASRHVWWVDSGNGENYGQVIIGNSEGQVRYTNDSIRALPLPIIQRPELLAQAPPDRSCADVSAEQGPTINIIMAAIVTEVVRRLIDGTCSWVQVYVDMERGIVSPVLATERTLQLLRKKGGVP